eukprot:2990072-Alexandrium_andersonii.AAC.1
MVEQLRDEEDELTEMERGRRNKLSAYVHSSFDTPAQPGNADNADQSATGDGTSLFNASAGYAAATTTST